MKYKGLTTQDVKSAQQKFGKNIMPEEKNKLFKKILKYSTSPVNIMLIIAAGLSLYTNKIFDFVFIIILALINAIITIWQEAKADNAINKLNSAIANTVFTIRDNNWIKIDTSELVPNDIIKLSVGDIIPADLEIIEQTNLSVNESALTGESLPNDKKEGDKVFSGTFIATGNTIAKVIKTGKETYLAKSISNINPNKQRSILEKDILSIAKYLTMISIASVIFLTIYLFAKNKPLDELLTLDLSIIIAGIPISLTTVMTLIIEFGALALYKKRVIVRRLSSLEELSNVNLLLTDKTGTLTKNEITIFDLKAYSIYSENSLLKFAYIAALEDSESPINKAIIHKYRSSSIDTSEYEIIKFIPADSERKHSTLIISQDSHTLTISIGASQIIEKLTKNQAPSSFTEDVKIYASKGYRTLAISIATDSKDEINSDIAGIIALSDTLREDATSVLNFLKKNKIQTIMLTGDNILIAKEIANKLNLTGDILKKKELPEDLKLENKDYQRISAFAELLPNDKYQIVKNAQKYYIVAANGDGVNDIPAIKAANVGIAVASAVSSLKSAADIVLLTDGISVIKDAIIESRKIFARLYSYAQYRISESFRLILTILLLGILVGEYPLTPLQIILLALLNDIPIISLAFDRVKIANKPSSINVKKRFTISSIFGLIGVVNSLAIFLICQYILKLDWNTIQTMFFLKLTVSGHLLIYVARTNERWYKYLPSREVIIATTLTQLIASIFAFTGFLMPASIPLELIIFVWIWAFAWMQIGEIAKFCFNKLH